MMLTRSTRSDDEPWANTMHGAGKRSGRQQVTVDEILQVDARIAGDVVEINATTWGIHGVIAVDGDVLIVEFDRREDARIVLEEIAALERAKGPSAP
jgi:hypothetical protein